MEDHQREALKMVQRHQMACLINTSLAITNNDIYYTLKTPYRCIDPTALSPRPLGY
jgi:hypothetical protein